VSTKIFSQDDDSTLINLYSTVSTKELVNILNGRFTSNQIKDRAKALGLKKDYNVVLEIKKNKTGAWEQWEKDIIDRFYSSDGIEKVHELLPHRSIQSIRHKAMRMGKKLNYDLFCKRHANGPTIHSDKTKKLFSEQRLGKPKSEEFKSKMSIVMSGSRHPNWQGGRSFIPYSADFNNSLKKTIFARDKYTCVLCRNKNSKKKLVVHHVDHDKSNSAPNNLVTLCTTCHNKHHAKSNLNVEYETKFFKEYLGT